MQPQLAGRLVRTRTLTTQLEGSLARERLIATVASVFGALALTLAAIGLYGLLALWVSRRTHEFGIRVALGARRLAVLRLVLRDAVNMLAIGGVTGIAAALTLSRFARSMLFGLSSHDPAALAGAIAALAVVGLGAAWLPAWRATKVDPLTALRTD